MKNSSRNFSQIIVSISGLLALFLFQNFTTLEAPVAQATSLNGMAEELVFKRWAPGIKEFEEKMNRKLSFSTNTKTGAQVEVTLLDQGQTQELQSFKMSFVNERVRFRSDTLKFSAEYNLIKRNFEFVRPISQNQSVSVEHWNEQGLSRVTWQSNW
jgi:hypothetical protein